MGALRMLMSRTLSPIRRWMALGALMLIIVPHTAIASDQADAQDKGWPRSYQIGGGNEVVLYQPQIDEWRDDTTLFARAAVAVKLKDAGEPTYGVLDLQSPTITDRGKRIVILSKPQILAVRFAGVMPEEASRLEAAVRFLPPAREPVTIALDRVLAYVKPSEQNWTGNGPAGGIAAKGADRSDSVVKRENGDVYAGKDGEVYRREPRGGWQKYAAGQWIDSGGSGRPVVGTGTQPSTGSTRGAESATGAPPEVNERLLFDEQARRSGSERAPRGGGCGGAAALRARRRPG